MKELVEIQHKLKAKKSQYNNFGKYHYRSCEDILEALKPLLSEHNCFITLSDDIVQVGDRIYNKATATFTNSEGNSVSVNAFAREPLSQKGMSECQVTGSASSYARKYALNGLFAIDDTKDDDTRDNTQNQEYILQIEELLVKTNTDRVKFLEYFKVANLNNLNITQQQQAIAMLNKKIKG